MTERIQEALARCGIGLWRINEEREETAELFFVKKLLDTRRIKDVHKYEVTVFRDGEKGRGSASVQLLPGMDDQALTQALEGAWSAAGFALNPTFQLPQAEKSPVVEKTGELFTAPLAQSAGKMARALFAADVQPDAFLNSAEIFVTRSFRRILSSQGTDVAYTDAAVKGEFVVQCRAPEDVEMYHSFEYDCLDEQALRSRAEEALRFVRDRAGAQRSLKSGSYDLILSGENLAEVLSYYKARSSASAIYAHYSTWQQGESVQGEKVEGEALELRLTATVPFSDEGIPMADLPLVREGKLAAIHGPNRFCRYLGVTPTGSYRKLTCQNGTVPFEALKKGPCLWAVTFSDFQMDPLSGHFGGELRLGYLIGADGTVTPVTGGSVNGSILDAQGALRFSAEMYRSADYDGPYALRLKGVSVAGT